MINRLEAMRTMLRSAQEGHGLLPEEFEEHDEIQDRVEELDKRVRSTWTSHSEPFNKRRSDLNSRLSAAHAGIEQAAERLAVAKIALNRGPAPPPGTAITGRVLKHQETLATAENEIADLKSVHEQTLSDIAALDDEERSALPGVAPAVQQLRPEVDALLAKAVAFHDRIVAKDKQSQTAVGAVVTQNRKEFSEARSYHRLQSTLLLLGLLLTFAGAAAVVLKMWAGPHHPTVTKEGHIDWPAVLLVFGGRISVIAALAWLLTFVGRLHARHAQQAVSYQNRLAALDIATMLLQTDRQEGRSETLKQMSAFYLTKGDNAFHGADPKEIEPRDVEKWLKAVTEPIEGIVKALGRGEPKG